MIWNSSLNNLRGWALVDQIIKAMLSTVTQEVYYIFMNVFCDLVSIVFIYILLGYSTIIMKMFMEMLGSKYIW